MATDQGSSETPRPAWVPDRRAAASWLNRVHHGVAGLLGPAALAISYFLAARVGEALAFPSAPVSAFWSPNAILFAVLLLVEPRRWWVYLLAVLPVHVLAQITVSPLSQVAIQYVLNCAEAVIGAVALVWREAKPRRFDSLSTAINLIVVGSLFAPFVTSVAMAGAFVALDLTDDFWLTTMARTVTNTFATLTLVPLICSAPQWLSGRSKALSFAIAGEMIAIGIALITVGVYVFVLPRESYANFPALLYAPLPLQLWATVRFGTNGACASILLVGALATWGVLHGVGPFDSPFPVQNALSLVIFLDVTCIPLMMLGAVLQERKATAVALVRSEARLRSIFEANLAPTLLCASDGRVAEANDAFLRLIGRKRHELHSGMIRWDELLRLEDPRRIEAAQRELAATGHLTAREAQLALPDGRTIPVFVGGCRLPDDSTMSVGFAFDLSELRHANAARKHAEALHRAVLASIEDQVAVLNEQGVVIEVNDSWRRAVARCDSMRRGRLPGQSYLATGPAVAQEGGEDCRAVDAALDAVLSGHSSREQVEFSFDSAEGVRWIEQTIEALQRPERGVVITRSDITARKRAELAVQEQHQQLSHLARVTSLGEFSGAIAHEIKQPLTAILGNGEAALRLLGAERPDLDSIRDCLRDIVADDLRAAAVIERLHSLLRNTKIQRVPLEVNEVAAEVLALARGDLQRRNITARTEFTPDLPPVSGDRVQIQQVILNLMMNACEAMEEVPEETRTLTLVTCRGQCPDEIEVQVRDAGTGVEEDLLQHIFEPFVTTKPDGLGLGLSICRSIVKAHEGRLWVESVRGGATFHLTLHAYH